MSSQDPQKQFQASLDVAQTKRQAMERALEETSAKRHEEAAAELSRAHEGALQEEQAVIAQTERRKVWKAGQKENAHAIEEMKRRKEAERKHWEDLKQKKRDEEKNAREYMHQMELATLNKQAHEQKKKRAKEERMNMIHEAEAEARLKKENLARAERKEKEIVAREARKERDGKALLIDEQKELLAQEFQKRRLQLANQQANELRELQAEYMRKKAMAKQGNALEARQLLNGIEREEQDRTRKLKQKFSEKSAQLEQEHAQKHMAFEREKRLALDESASDERKETEMLHRNTLTAMHDEDRRVNDTRHEADMKEKEIRSSETWKQVQAEAERRQRQRNDSFVDPNKKPL